MLKSTFLVEYFYTETPAITGNRPLLSGLYAGICILPKCHEAKDKWPFLCNRISELAVTFATS